jgi:hypothetical protein
VSLDTRAPRLSVSRDCPQWVINGGTDRPAHWSAYTPTFSVIADMTASRP